MLKYVTKDIEKDLDYVDLVGLQMNATSAVQDAITMGRLPSDTNIADWDTASNEPAKYKGFWVTFFAGLFLGKGNSDINIDYQLDTLDIEKGGRRVAMFWLPYRTKITDVLKIGEIAKEAIGGSYEVIVLSSKTTNNKRAEEYVKKKLANTSKPVLIISAVLAQRSFSIGEIYETYLAYDRGSDGSTQQKFSRALTTDSTNRDKKAVIVSLSFDPNRDDKFDKYLIESAERLGKRNGKTIVENLKIVSNAFNIFNCTQNGAIKLMVDEFVQQSMSRGSASKVFAHKVRLNDIPMDIKMKLVGHGLFRFDKKDVVKTKLSKREKKELIKSPAYKAGSGNFEYKVREALFALIENCEYILGAGRSLGANGILESFSAFENMENSKEMIEDITKIYGIDYYLIKQIIENGWVKAEWIDFKNNKKVVNDR